MDLNCSDKLISEILFTEYIREIWRFEKNSQMNLIIFLITFFSLAYFIVKIQNIIHTTYKNVLQQFILPIKLPINSRLLVVKCWGTQNLCMGFYSMGGGLHP